MGGYIERDAVIKWVESWLNMGRYFRPNGENDDIPITELYALLKQIPAVDAVQVVRCKDCKYSEHWYGDRNRCFLWVEDGIGVFEDGFCSYGERKGVDE